MLFTYIKNPMNKRVVYIFAFVSLLVPTAYRARADSNLPNVLIILADDVGFGDIPANYPEALVPMPNVQRLADNGVRFLDAHSTSAVCAPTRYSLLSGNYPWRGRRPYGTWNYNGGTQFKNGQISLAQMLKDVGYNTSMFGKVHLGAHVQPREEGASFDENWHPHPKTLDFTRPLVGGPKDLGFDYSFTTPAGIQDNPYAYFENDVMVEDPETLIRWTAGNYHNENGFSSINRKHDGWGVPNWESNSYAIDMLIRAMGFLDRHVESNKASGEDHPFFMHYCAAAVHVPHSPPEDFFGTPVLDQTPSHHLDMLLELDLTVGKLIRELEVRGLLENTLVIFTSDNGGLGYSDKLGHDASGGFRGNKVSVYEGGHRIPMIMSWVKGGIPMGVTYESLTGIQDLYKTIADVANVEVPAEQAIDSLSFKPQLFGEVQTPHRTNQMAQTIKRKGDLAYRKNEWKLIMKVDGQPFEFYNLAQDSAEENNLLNNPEFASKIKQVHREFMELDPTGLIRSNTKNKN